MFDKKYFILFFVTAASFCCTAALAQTPVEGYLFENNNRGYLNEATVSIYELPKNTILVIANTDDFGHFSAILAPGLYRVSAHKDMFEDRQDTVQVQGDKIFLKMEMRRKPGYLLEAKLLETRGNSNTPPIAVKNATVEVYNRTADTAELELQRYNKNTFQHPFEQGNHYTLMIRKPGYLVRRIEVKINIDDCILCIDGEEQHVIDLSLNADNRRVIPMAIELERMLIGKRIQVPMTYADNEHENAPLTSPDQLEKIWMLMKDNQEISIELSSHTDARANDESNLKLSQKRAEFEAGYLIAKGIAPERITAKGYGETKLTNKCKNWITCTEAEHQQNRRTEVLITGITENALEPLKLEDIMKEEKMTQRPDELASMTPREQQLPEANNSIQLPELSGNAAGEIPEESIASGAPQNRSNPENPSRTAGVKVSPLDTMFTGYAIQLLKSPTALNPAYPVFKDFKNVYWKQESDGAFYYYLLPAEPLNQLRKYLRKTIQPNHREARLLRFEKTGKVYIK